MAAGFMLYSAFGITMPQLEQSEALLIASNCSPGSTSDDFIAPIKIYFRSICDSKFRNVLWLRFLRIHGL